MKGLIFTEFFNMVEKNFSPEILDKIIIAANLPNQGAYTSVGTYNHTELISLVSHLSELTKLSIPDLQLAYGRYLFTHLMQRYPDFVLAAQNSFEFLQTIDNHIHVEVRKLYPEAELPRFQCTLINDTCMSMDYYSSRPFSNLAQGLIEGCIAQYKEKIIIHSALLQEKGKEFVRFTLQKEQPH